MSSTSLSGVAQQPNDSRARVRLVETGRAAPTPTFAHCHALLEAFVFGRRTMQCRHRRLSQIRCHRDTVTNMSKESGDSRDSTVMDRLYEIAESQGGLLAAHQALDAGISRSTLSYHAGEGRALERVMHGVYRLRRFPAPPHGHVIAGWLAVARADAVVSHESALELLDLTDVIADEVHVTLPRAKRGLRTPPGVRVHFTERLIHEPQRRHVQGVTVTSVERTLADLLRAGGWTEQIDLAIRQAIQRGLTTPRRLRTELPATWRPRLDAALEETRA
jgi:predicted transcriptional regulator of viral defense system